MKPDIEKLRKKYMDNPPEGMSSRDIRRMSEEEQIGRASCRERVSSPV